MSPQTLGAELLMMLGGGLWLQPRNKEEPGIVGLPPSEGHHRHEATAAVVDTATFIDFRFRFFPQFPSHLHHPRSVATGPG